MKINVISFLLFSASLTSYAQELTTDNVTLTITPGAQVTVKGDIQNQNAATITNNGTIDLSGNWINNAANDCFGTSQGLVILNGAAQTIGGTNSTMFNSLFLQGSGTKTLLINTISGGGNALPIGVLQLNAQILDLNSNTLTINNSAPSAITRTTGFIISETPPASGYGIIRWNIGASSAGNNYIFPFGNATTNNFLPVNFNVVTGGSGASGSVSISTYPTVTSATPNNRPLPTGLTSLMSLSGAENAPFVLDRFWIFNVQDYTTRPVASLGFNYRESEWDASSGSTNTIIETQLQSQFFNGTVWSFPTTGVVNTVANTVTVPSVNNYNSIWALVGSSSPLPVTLLEFTAKPVNNLEVLCKWTTASEINNDYFTVERSQNGSYFEPIGTVPGSGNSIQLLNYSFTDHEPYGGISYYRLKQTDFDGADSYSEVIAVHIENGTQNSFQIYPNPAIGVIYIVHDSDNAPDVEIFDMTGRRVLTMQIGKTFGEINISSLASGSYLVRMQEKQVRMVKQ